MFRHLIYVCPKCQNTLLLSNKMLHDLRCTESNPATYEKILSEQKNNNNENTPKKKSLRFSNGLRKSNVDGTSSDIKKNIKSDGREEYIETKYDTEGNIISRKKRLIILMIVIMKIILKKIIMKKLMNLMKKKMIIILII